MFLDAVKSGLDVMCQKVFVDVSQPSKLETEKSVKHYCPQ